MTEADRWWRGATVYQIYVRSFQDSNGDGAGDLRGVIQRLGYLHELGVSAIWLSPTMPSPNADWGYDVSDYRSVHPYLGSLDTMDELIGESSRLGIRVLLDLVPNHTSSVHPWFTEARSDRSSRYRDWYVWADPDPDGNPPNNWLDATGASAWTFDEPSGQYYLHNFLSSQPDLNWWNPKVHAAFDDILRFWFDRGIAGFRIDVAHGLYKDRGLRDNPPAGPSSFGHYGLEPLYNANRPEVHGVYRRWRRIAQGYDPPKLLLGETWVRRLEDLPLYYGDDDELQLCFNFFFVASDFDVASLSGIVERTLSCLPAGACPVWVGSNHDISRFPTRWAHGNPAKARLALAVLATLPGTLVLYQGDELGLPDVQLSPEDQRDLMTRGFADSRFTRDSARTPMPWDDSNGAGFAIAGVQPWLPMGDRRGSSVSAQSDEPGSFLNLTRALISLRRGAGSARSWSYDRLPSETDQWIYRSGPVVLAANFSDQPALLRVPPGKVLLRTGPKSPGSVGEPCRDGRVEADPWEAVLLDVGSVPGGTTHGNEDNQ